MNQSHRSFVCRGYELVIQSEFLDSILPFKKNRCISYDIYIPVHITNEIKTKHFYFLLRSLDLSALLLNSNPAHSGLRRLLLQ